MEPSLVDIGVNLSDPVFRADLPEVLARARQASVRVMIVTGTSSAASRSALELAEEHKGVLWATAGVHPHHAKEWDPSQIEVLRSLARHPQCVALGECGLDYNRDFSPRPAQRRCFEAQLELACALKKPLFVHERDASSEVLDMLERHRDDLVDAVVHCFTGSSDTLRRYLDLDIHIGITGWICDERRGQKLQEMVSDIPLHRLMLETDAPYLLPRTIRPRPKSRRNEPANLPYVLETVARCRGQSQEAVAAATTETALRFFRLPPPELP